MFKDFEPFCWFGFGYCPPEAEIKGSESDEAKEVIKYFLSEPVRVSLEWMGLEYKPNWDTILALIFAIVVSCLTSWIVIRCYFLRRPFSTRRPQTAPQRQVVVPCHPFTEDNDPDDKIPTSASLNARDVNNNVANLGENSAGSAFLNPFRGGWSWKSNSCQITNNATRPIPVEPRLSIPEIRNQAVINRIASSEVGPTIFPRHLNSGKRISIRSLTNLLETRNVPPVLIFHQMPRAAGISYQNVESLKLETIIRLCEIPHVIVNDATSVTEPWLTYGGVDCIGIDNCLQLLSRKFPSPFQSCQVPAANVVPARFIKIITECDLNMAVLAWRSFNEDEENDMIDFDDKEYELQDYMSECHEKFDGMNPDYLRLEIEKSLEILSASLGNKDFFVGQSMTILDCSVFAVMAQFMCKSVPNSIVMKRIIQKHPNLVRFCTHFRDHLWKDWDSEVLSGNLLSTRGSSELNLDALPVNFVENDNSQYDRVSEDEHEGVPQPQQQGFWMDNICGVFGGTRANRKHSQARRATSGRVHEPQAFGLPNPA